MSRANAARFGTRMAFSLEGIGGLSRDVFGGESVFEGVEGGLFFLFPSCNFREFRFWALFLEFAGSDLE